MNIIFFGTPEFAVLPLQYIHRSVHDVIAVVTQPDRQSGRGRRLTPSPVKQEAQNSGIRVLQPRSVRDPEFINTLRGLNPSVIVVAAYGQILPPEIIHLPESGCVNIHASLLPAYRGAAPINWAIINGEKKTGITTMLMDEGMDTGSVLMQQETVISADDTAGSLSVRLSEIGADLLLLTLQKMESREISPEAQKGEASYAPPLKKSDGLIIWSQPAEALSRFIRGMNPWPGAYTFLLGERIKILKALPCDGAGAAGVIKAADKDHLVVGTARGTLSVTEIQPPGKPVMRIESFLQGRKLREGMKFE